MCGLAGAFAAHADEAAATTAAMLDHLVPRGPDAGGLEIFAAPGGAVALAARRLAIIDPSPAGHQPMCDAERQTTIVFNGMIYNFRELRAELAALGERFFSDSDTEVVLRAYSRWGAGCLRRLRGMFAFAVWDARREELFLARDPLGIKPLYWWHGSGRFLFASQVKTLVASGLVPVRLSPEGIESFLAFGAVSEPLTALEGVSAVPAGHAGVYRDGRLALEQYWRPPAELRETTSRGAAAKTLRALLEDSVQRHLISDAPLGVFLSGGLDSSILAALAARETPHLRTVSVTFRGSELSEAHYIERVVAHLGTEHVSIALASTQLLDWLDDAFAAMDQPSFDAVNTYVVSRGAASSGLKVAMSGLGADELFDGYSLVRGARALDRLCRLPAPLRRSAVRVLGRPSMSGRAEKLRSWAHGEFDRGASYELLRRLFLPEEVRRLAPRAPAGPRPRLARDRDLFNQISLLDLGNYMRNVLLRDTDAMSMANSLEVRVPYLDTPLVEWALAHSHSVKARRPKALLIEAAGDLVPRELWQRPKQGFVLPLADWMRSDLHDEIDAQLADPPSAVAEQVDPDALRSIWRTFEQDGRRWLAAWSLYALCRWTDSLTEPARRSTQEMVA